MINIIKDIIFGLLYRQTITISPDTLLKGKVVVITGASKGLGKATAEVLHSKGASVVLVARKLEELKKASAKFSGKKMELVSADVTNPDDCERIIAKTIAKFGKVDVLINNAGMFSGTLLEQTSVEEWDRSLSLNSKAVFLMAKAVIPSMKKRKQGLIINVGSKISRNTQITEKKVLYATTKYAVEGFSNALYSELKPFGIRVTCLMPGTMSTVRSVQAAKYLSPYRIAQLLATIITLDDVAFEDVVVTSKYQDL